MPKRAQLFATCLLNELRPEAGFAVAKVLERLGWELEVPDLQACCGQPAFNGGYLEEARKVALATMRAFQGGPGPLIVPSGSCAEMLRHQLPGFFAAGSPERAEAEALAARVREFSQFLVDDLNTTELGAKSEAKVAYHPSCHLMRGLGVIEQPLRLLRAVEGASLLPFPGADECCGFGGSFSVTHDQISGAMLGQKLDSLSQAGPDTVVSCDLGCLMHLEGGMRRRNWKPRVLHLAQFLAESLP